MLNKFKGKTTNQLMTFLIVKLSPGYIVSE